MSINAARIYVLSLSLCVPLFGCSGSESSSNSGPLGGADAGMSMDAASRATDVGPPSSVDASASRDTGAPGSDAEPVSDGGPAADATNSDDGAMGDERFAACQERCTADEDCLADYSCQNGICWPTAAPDTSCDGDTECVVLFSGWTTACAGPDDCPGAAAGTQACIEYEAGGRCAFVPGDTLSCDTFQQTEIEARSFPGGDAIRACAQDRATCVEGACQLPCRSDDHCPSPEYPSCNLDTGWCACQPGSCVTNASVCGDDGFCRCTADSDCTEGNVDSCLDGFCGCSSASICPGMTTHPGTEWVCEP